MAVPNFTFSTGDEPADDPADDHSGHDHSGHDHSGCGHDHSGGHDHHGHDHDHDHSHSQPHPPPPQLKHYPLTENELRENYTMITDDGGIKKKILVESTEKQLGCPPVNSKIKCHYVGTLPNKNDEKFDSSRDRGDPFEFKIGAGSVIKGWDIGIASMYRGEKCILRCSSEYAYGENGSPPKIGANETLDFEVELLEWDDWVEINNGDLKKKILIASSDGPSGDTIDDDDTVSINYRVYYVNNDVDNNLCLKKDISLLVGDDDTFTSAFHMALGSMKKGEKALFKVLNNDLINDVYISPDELKQNEFNNNSLKSPAEFYTYYEIQINDLKKTTPKYKAKNEERIKYGLQYKTDGNTLFKQSRFSGALSKYHKAISWVDINFSDDDLLKQKNKIVVDCNNNISLIYIKLKDWGNAIRFASSALDNDSSNVKALMRRGQAYIYVDDFDLAKKDLKKADKLNKDNKYVKKLLKIAINKKKEFNKKQQALYAKMFDAGNTNKKKKKKKKKNKDQKKLDKIDVDKDNTDNKANDDVTTTTNTTNADNNDNIMDVDKDKAVAV